MTTNSNWENNSIQFPRLIAELETSGVFDDNQLVNHVCEEMDISHDEFFNLIERAQSEWDKIKSLT